MTLSATCRLRLHQTARARSMTDLYRIGVLLGIDPLLPFAIWRRRFVRAVAMMRDLAVTLPIVAVPARFAKN